MTRREAQQYRDKIESAAESMSDNDALKAVELFPAWIAGTEYPEGKRIRHNGILYKVMQPHTALEHQPPGAQGMLAIYRPVEIEHVGTQLDPIPWAYGIDCVSELYYLYNEKLYLCKADMQACIWAPGTPGLWQWEEVER